MRRPAVKYGGVRESAGAQMTHAQALRLKALAATRRELKEAVPGPPPFCELVSPKQIDIAGKLDWSLPGALCWISKGIHPPPFPLVLKTGGRSRPLAT